MLAGHDSNILDAFNDGNHRTTLANADGDDNAHGDGDDVFVESRTLQVIALILDCVRFPRKTYSIPNVNIASEYTPLRGTLVSGCPVGKVRKTNVSSWSFNTFIFTFW